MAQRGIKQQEARNENVTRFLFRLKNFFRHPLAAADVPPGKNWAARDAYDPWVEISGNE